MKALRLSFLSAFLILLSCGGSSFSEKGAVYECIKDSLPAHHQNLDLLADIFEEDELIDGSRESYARELKSLFNHNYGDFELNSKQSFQLEFTLDLSALPILCECAQLAEEEHDLSQAQIQFYKELSEMPSTGAHENKKLGELVEQMTKDEFQSNGITEASIIYLSYVLFRNYYVFHFLEN